MKGSKVILFVLWWWLPLVAGAQERDVLSVTCPSGQEMLVGWGDRSDMEQPPYSGWFDHTYAEYHPDDSSLHVLRGTPLSGMEVLVVLGTWCPDSRREVPRFFRVADVLEIPDTNIRVLYVDRSKKAPRMEEDTLRIERVPTFIFYFDGKEVARIIEVPQGSFEEEFGRIARIMREKKQ